MANWEQSNRETQEELRKLRRSVENLDRRIEKMSSTFNTGLASLQQADSDLAAAVTAAVADIATLSAQLTAVNSEDPEVAKIAADLETKVTALNAAVNPPAPPAAAVS